MSLSAVLRFDQGRDCIVCILGVEGLGFRVLGVKVVYSECRYACTHACVYICVYVSIYMYMHVG